MIKKLDLWFIRVNQIVLGFLMLIMFLLVSGNVIGRYFFRYSFNWAEELASIIMIWITFLGIGLAMRAGQIVAIETLYDYLPKRIALVVRALVALIIICFMVFLSYLGFLYSNATIAQLSPSLRWSLGLIYLAIPLGSIIFILHFVAVLQRFFNGTLFNEVQSEHGEIGGEVRD
jgi:TRAP-type C4-dicarboxylate transport system permease small subunit